MKDFKSNLLIICFDEEFGIDVSKVLADALDMICGNCKDYINYDISALDVLSDNMTYEYLQNLENKAVKNFKNFENTLIFIDYFYFEKHKDVFKENYTKIYLRLPQSYFKELRYVKNKEKAFLFSKDYKRFDEEVRSCVDYCISLNQPNIKLAYNKIIEILGENI